MVSGFGMNFAECLALVVLTGAGAFGTALLVFWFLPYWVVRYTADDQMRERVLRYIEERQMGRYPE